MNVLLTFTGFHDPFADSAVAGEKEAGPVLTAVAERSFDRVYLFSTPSTAEISAETKAQLEKRHPGLEVEICELPLKDPTNYLGILKQVRTQFGRIKRKLPDAVYSISVSSGTPHMHASWLMLAASGEIPASIIQSRASKYARDGHSRVTEIDFNNPQFPQIKPFGALPDESQDQEFQSVCAQLGIVGDNPQFVAALKSAHTLAQYDSPVLLLGETGAGKEVFAQLVHNASDRASKPFVTVNCAAFPESLIESELFGHTKGAFTGAIGARKGCFEAANGGTLFLDELGEMPMPSQAKLLRAIQHGRIQKLGESKETQVNVRIIAATNVDIKQAVEEKRLRKDLYFRLQTSIRIPPLSERRDDISKLARHFLEKWNQQYQKQRRISQDAILALMKHPWPGNVRELESVVVRSTQLCSGAIIKPENLVFDETLAESGWVALPEPHDGFDIKQYLADQRQRLMERAVEMSDGNLTKAAKLLGLTPQAMSQNLKDKRK